MIDIAGTVGLASSVDHFLIANRKEVFAVIGAHLAFGKRAPGIFDHAAAFFYWAKSKEANPRVRALRCEVMLANCKFSFRHVGLLVEKTLICKRNNYLHLWASV